MTLYEISDLKNQIDALYEKTFDEETGEIKKDEYEKVEAFEKALEKLFSEKIDGIIKYLRNIDTDIEVIKEEEKRLKQRRERLDKKKEWLKGYILLNMQKLGYKKIETPLGTLSQRKSKTTIVDENIIPKDERYWTVKLENKYDKKKIKELIESGEHIDGAFIRENVSLNIK